MSNSPIAFEPRRPTRSDADLRSNFETLQARARRLCGDASDANDLVQDTYERALRASPSGIFEGRWLNTVMRNLWVDEWRRRRRQPQVPLDDEPIAAPIVACSRLLEDRFERAVAGLDAEVRRTFEMRFRENCSYDEIARRLSVPKSTVGTRLMRARRMIHAIVADD